MSGYNISMSIPSFSPPPGDKARAEKEANTRNARTAVVVYICALFKCITYTFFPFLHINALLDSSRRIGQCSKNIEE
jgi:hypothetical protein